MSEWKEVTTEDLENHPELITRLARLESIVRGLVSMQGIDRQNNKYDVDGVRKATSDITPYTETKKGYYGESEKVFYDAPSGNTSVFFSDYNGNYTVNRIANRLIVSFDTLAKETDITISII